MFFLFFVFIILIFIFTQVLGYCSRFSVNPIAATTREPVKNVIQIHVV